MIHNFGSLNIDHVYRVPAFVRPGETLASSSYASHLGGKGANQSIALARAGAPVRHVGLVGSDGLWLRKALADEGIAVEALRACAAATGHALIQVSDQGENAIILHGGANQAFTRELVAQALATCQPGDVILMQNETNANGWLLEMAPPLALRLHLNAAPFHPSLAAWPLEKLDTLYVNETEGEGLTGEREPEAILAQLTRRYPQLTVVLTLGAAGAIYAKGIDRLAVEGRRVTVVDTTAAGDTFIGYYLAAMHRGEGARGALTEARDAAAIAVTRAGAAPSIPQRKGLLDHPVFEKTLR